MNLILIGIILNSFHPVLSERKRCLPDNLLPALEGFDPRFSDAFVSPDPASKKAVFEQCSNTFNIEHKPRGISCDGAFTGRLLDSVEEYVREKNSRFSYASEKDSSGMPDSSPEASIVEHYRKSGRVIVFHMKCFTHIVTLDEGNPNFDESFVTMVQNLAKHSENPDTPEAKQAVTQFVANYGTHYKKSSAFGSSLTIEIVAEDSPMLSFSQFGKAATIVNENFFEGTRLIDISPFICEHSRCGEITINVVHHGGLTNNSLRYWRENVDKYPAVQKSELVLLTDLVMKTGHYLMIHPEHIVRLLEHHKWLELDSKPNLVLPVPRLARTRRLSVVPTKSRFAKLDNLKEKVVRTGGLEQSGGLVSVVETQNLKSLPDIPEPVYGHTLTYLGHGVLLQLGGVGSTKALTLNTSAEDPQWVEMEGMNYFNNKSYFTSVKLSGQSSPWVVFDSKLHTFDFSGNIEIINLPFNVTTGHCAVANDHYMYIIGAGNNRDEIWVNSMAGNPLSFSKVAMLPEGRRHHACLWIGNDIFIHGGLKNEERSSQNRYKIDWLYVFKLQEGFIENWMPLGKRMFHALQLDVTKEKIYMLGGVSLNTGHNYDRYDCILYYQKGLRIFKKYQCNVQFPRGLNSFALVQFN